MERHITRHILRDALKWTVQKAMLGAAAPECQDVEVIVVALVGAASAAAK
jgi:hypothetical protein